MNIGNFGNSVYAWFGKVWEPSEYKGLNAASFLENDFAEDVAGIKWLKKNVKVAGSCRTVSVR